MLHTLRLLFVITFLGFQAQAYPLFKWVDPVRKLHNQIDLNTLVYFEEVRAGVFTPMGSVNWDASDLKEMPAEWVDPFYFQLRGKDYFSIRGTGHVYTWEKATRTMKRLDRTFFRGYNFISTQFVRRDTLFSFGGYGFWNIHATASFYDFKKGEWDLVNYKNEGPQRITFDLSGYDAKRDKFVAIEVNKNFEHDYTGQSSVFEFDFNLHQWTLLGYLDNSRLMKMGVNPEKAKWLNGYFLFNDGPDPVIVDPFKNEFWAYKGSNKFLISRNKETYLLQDTVVSHRFLSTSSDSLRVEFDKTTMDLLFKDSELIGPMYSKPKWFRQFIWQDWTLLGLLILGVFCALRYRKVRNKMDGGIALQGISVIELSFFQLFQEHGLDYCLSTNDLNQLIGCDKKSVENQKQIRNRFVLALNQSIKEHFGVEECIVRKTSEQDKRFMLYCLSEGGKRVISQMQKSKLI
jgi:hypothetical protein